ncbi:uncharacterized protein N7459_007108 [Penicillium hispanicum]|uniref:uncharacterized protein n=1 Tax=Penicillium hispanicum TaxID=1080232 RepID=UPI002541A5D4|nr:uncharacterized protein N7459_007108 [Penicillium hispanicum]KAJ5578144.1 hypothetical protein N7459_007108 [Penicillium hispanicum]
MGKEGWTSELTDVLDVDPSDSTFSPWRSSPGNATVPDHARDSFPQIAEIEESENFRLGRRLRRMQGEEERSVVVSCLSTQGREVAD